MVKQELIEKQEFYNKNKKCLDIELLQKIDKAFDIDFAYNSTTIEGNTLTLIETKAVLEDNISIGGKELREIYEVINHSKAFEYVKQCIEKQQYLDESKIKDIHELLTKNIMQGGIYRSTDVIITGAKHTPPTPNEMYNQLKFFYQDLEINLKQMDPIKLAAWTHTQFVKIHPFLDGNGRTSRLIMNYQLIISGFLPISIHAQDKLEYYNLLDLYATTGNLEPFEKLIEQLEEKRLDEINKMICQQLEANNEA